jgi:antitoxin ParD1/3/4
MQMMTFNKQRMEERDQLREIRLEDLRREVQKGIDSGESTPLDLEEIKARGRERLAGRTAKG